MKYFQRSEFACKCGCGFDTVDFRLAEIVEAVREHFDSPVIVTSACRCARHNAAVGGGVRSQHLYGRAADIKVKGVEPTEVSNFVNQFWPTNTGVGTYSTFTHIDTRGTRARWTG